MGKTKKVYLFDTENEGSTRILAYLKNHNITGCDLYLFYTDTNKSNAQSLTKQIKNNTIHEVHCEKGSNALDIQLIAYMGMLLKKDPDNEYVIISHDTDFEPPVRIFTSNGIKVSLESENEDPKIRKAVCILNKYLSKDGKWSVQDKEIIAGCAADSNGKPVIFGQLLSIHYTKSERHSLYKALTDKGRTELLS